MPKFSKIIAQLDFSIEQFLKTLGYYSLLFVSSNKPSSISKDPTDDKFLHCAEISKSSFLISGDKHLLQIKKYKEIKILSPAQFLKIKF